MLAVISTVCETGVAIALIAGFKTRWAALGAAILLTIFALAMTISSTVKDPLDYSVFTAAAGAFLLATAPKYRLSVDAKLKINS